MGEDVSKIDSEDTRALIEACGLPWADEKAHKDAEQRYSVEWGASRKTIIRRSTDV